MNKPPFEPDWHYDNSPTGLLEKFCHDLMIWPQVKFPVDDFFDEDEKFRPRRLIFLRDGAAAYIREFLSCWYSEDRTLARHRAKVAHLTIDQIDDAMASIETVLHSCKSEAVSQAIATKILTPQVWELEAEGAARWKAYWKNLQVIEASFWSLVALRNIAREQSELSRANPWKRAEKQFWKHDFVKFVAHLWRNLFSQYPSVAPDSRFVEFLDSIWSSIDPENRFPQNWERAVRVAVGELKRQNQ